MCLRNFALIASYFSVPFSEVNMIKKLALALPFSLALAMAPLSSFAAKFYEGTHYHQITDKAPSSEPKLTEFFSFYCHNCFAFESEYMPSIKPHLNKNIQFETKHVEFKPSHVMEEVMRSLAVIQQVGKGNKQISAMNIAMFNAIQGEEAQTNHVHQEGDVHEPTIKSRDDIKQIFAKFGIDAKHYDKLADNKITNEKLKLWRQQQKEFRIQSVPAFIVNEKYEVNLNSIRTLSEMVDLINFLSNKTS